MQALRPQDETTLVLQAVRAGPHVRRTTTLEGNEMICAILGHLRVWNVKQQCYTCSECGTVVP